MHYILMSMIRMLSKNKFLSLVLSAEVTSPASRVAREAQAPMNDAQGAW